jgi:outer membrane protein assembly factor BamB
VRIGSGVVIDRVIYMANADSAGSIQCLDLETGAERWNARRTSDGPHWGSLVETHGILYVTGQHGITRVMKANPDEYELLAENDLGEQSNSTPALSNGEIFLRTWEALYCVSK